MTLCKDCKHFKIMQQPIKGFDWGMAECTKYDLVVDFADRRKFKWLSCEDRPKNTEREERGMTRQEAIHELEDIFSYGFYNPKVDEAVSMAIEALKSEDAMLKEIERTLLYGERSEE